jgi:hypothetical protein
MWVIQSWFKMKVGNHGSKFCHCSEEVVDNHPSIEDGNKLDKALTKI